MTLEGYFGKGDFQNLEAEGGEVCILGIVKNHALTALKMELKVSRF